MSCTLLERFLRYVTMETTSDPASETVPSTDTQLKLADLLTEELKEMGLEARRDGMGYVYASIPAAKGYEKAPAIGFIAHMDTSDAVSGKDVRPGSWKTTTAGSWCSTGRTARSFPRRSSRT